VGDGPATWIRDGRREPLAAPSHQHGRGRGRRPHPRRV